MCAGRSRPEVLQNKMTCRYPSSSIYRQNCSHHSSTHHVLVPVYSRLTTHSTYRLHKGKAEFTATPVIQEEFYKYGPHSTVVSHTVTPIASRLIGLHLHPSDVLTTSGGFNQNNQSVAPDGTSMRPPQKETCVLVEILRVISTVQ
jgi:hypothetical protein